MSTTRCRVKSRPFEGNAVSPYVKGVVNIIEAIGSIVTLIAAPCRYPTSLTPLRPVPWARP
jgi:hypothetical protein